MKRFKKISILLSIITGIFAFLYFENNAIAITRINIKTDKMTKASGSLKIVHLSDLHSKSFGRNQKDLLKKIADIKPDIIVFTGDLVDTSHYDKEVSMELMKGIVKYAPVYYVNGNHEIWSGRFASLEKKLKEAGVHVLRNAHEEIQFGQDKISIIGIDDADGEAVQEELEKATKGIEKSGNLNLLLAHRPESFQIYSQNNLDLIFSGHAHGGQVRLPYIGGIIAPNQGFFPKYTAGVYKNASSGMVVSRGLGNSVIPQRLFNRPEIVVVDLSSKVN